MKYGARIVAAVFAAASFTPVFAQTWCGKNFMANQSVVPPGGQFQLPPTSNNSLVAFRCAPVFRPYLKEDAKNASFVVDTPIVYQYIQGASPISLPSSNSSYSEPTYLGSMGVTITIGNKVLAKAEVPLNTTGYEVSVRLDSLKVQKTPYNVICTATYQAGTSGKPKTQNFSTNASLLYLPDTNGSVVKTDLRSGALLARPANGQGGNFQPFVPQGFYVSVDQYLAKNLSLINQLRADGFNTIHPIPPYDNATLFQQVLDRALELGLYVIFDMRSVYQNLTAVAQQVKAYGSVPNLLLWETAHEPDGSSDPLYAARDAYDLIYELDGYHPVSILLNCQNYNFAPYVEGADIVLEDAYPIGINATFSPVWHTPCTPDFGHCGCDNCQGNIQDIEARVQTFKDRLNILGYDRTKTVWAVPQAFGSGAYWNTTPTGQEWAAMQITSFSHGAFGSISFQYPTSTGSVATIEGTAPGFNAVISQSIQPFLVDPTATFQTFSALGLDAGLVNNGTTYLLLTVNFNTSAVFVPWDQIGLGQVNTSAIARVFSVFQHTNTSGLDCFGGEYCIGIYTVPVPKQFSG